MRKLFVLIVLLKFSATYSQQISIDSIITKSSIYHNLSALAHDSMGGRAAGTAYADKTERFIAQSFEKIGLLKLRKPSGYLIPFSGLGFLKNTVKGNNVVGFLPGQKYTSPFVIISAHYDHVGVSPFETEDSIFNGANDNASGVTALLEIAKLYKSEKLNNYPILFIAFGGEEEGLVGSEYIAGQFRQMHIAAVLNIDMIGRPGYKKNACSIISDKSGFYSDLFNKQVGNPSAFVANPISDLYFRSDHYSFRHIPVHLTFTATPDTDKYYHRLSDETSTIDFNFLTTTIKNIAEACLYYVQ